MNYTIFTRRQITPQFITVQEAEGTSTRLNPGVPAGYPATFFGQPIRLKDFDPYSSDPLKRRELWGDTAGKATPEEAAPFLAIVFEREVSALWYAATKWQEQFISGLAGGILTIGVMKQAPIALSILQWSGELWNEYYRRKALILSGIPASYDFSSCGPMPFSIPELRSELGV